MLKERPAPTGLILVLGLLTCLLLAALPAMAAGSVPPEAAHAVIAGHAPAPRLVSGR
jgi:hypothetical protein